MWRIVIKMNIRSFLYFTSSSLSPIYIYAVTCILDCLCQFSSPPPHENFVRLASISAPVTARVGYWKQKSFYFTCWYKFCENRILLLAFNKAPVEYANLYATLDLRTKRVIYNHNKKIISLLRASLCKILISSFAHIMDFAHNFSVDFF